MRNTYKILVRKPEWKGALGRKEIGCEDVDWIQLAQDKVQWWALVNMTINPWVL
jgi:hypothetical protein